MSIVQFLETLGASPNGMSASGLDAAARDILLARDAEGINRLIGGRAVMRCLIVTTD